MKAFLFSLLVVVSFSLPVARAEQCGPADGKMSLEEILLKKSKLRHDQQARGLDWQGLTACRGPGFSCKGSLDCCGSSFCRDGHCSDTGNSCRGPGTKCGGSLDCCGSSFCRDGYCSDTNNSCRQEGAKCNGSLDCCGSLFCRDGFCG